MSATNTAPAPAPATFTACAVVRTYSETLTPHTWNAETKSHEAGEEYTRVTETGRIEFVPVGEWVLVRANDMRSVGTWYPYTRADARALYKSVIAGTNTHYRGKWTPAEAATVIVGAVEMPARRETYSYGETAYMYTEVNLSAMVCPVIDMGRGRKCVAQPFAYTTPPTPGDRHSHDRVAIQWREVA